VLKQVLLGYTPEFRTNSSGLNQLFAVTTATPNQAFVEARPHPHPQLHQPQHPLLLLLQPVDVPTNLIGPILTEMTVHGMKIPVTARTGDLLEPMMLAVCVEEDQMTGQRPHPHPQLGQPLPVRLHLLLLQPVDVPTNLIGPILMEMTVHGMKIPVTARTGDILEPMMLVVCVEEDQMTGQRPAPIHLHQPQRPLLLLLQPVDVPTNLIGPILTEMTVPGMKIPVTARTGDLLEPMMLVVCVEEDQMTGQRPAPIHQRQVQWPLPQLLTYVRTMMRSSRTYQHRNIANLWERITHQFVVIGQE